MHDTGFIGLRLTQYRQILTKYDKAGLPNHLGQMVQTPEEIDRCMALTDPKLFYFRPDTAHLYLGGLLLVPQRFFAIPATSSSTYNDNM
jgi:hypothetical protein